MHSRMYIMDKKLNIVILAAGKGTRMKSNLPKVLHKLAGKPLLQHVVDCAKSLNPQKIIVVYGFGGDAVPSAMKHEDITWVEQTQQLGTGHAVMQVLPHLEQDATTLILLGDVPLVSAESCQQLLNETDALGLMTVYKQDPGSYGRIVREQNQVTEIVEYKDANEAQRKIHEVNTGIIAARNDKLTSWVENLSNQNAQQEYYLTDIVAMAVRAGNQVAAMIALDEASVEGVNSKVDLAGLERVHQMRIATQLMQHGVNLADPSRIDVRGSLLCGQDVAIDVNCVFEGVVQLGDGVVIGANCVIKNACIGAKTHVAAFTHIDDTQIGENSRIGPFARLRPGTTLAEQTHIGNFVELKNAQVDAGSKVNHLSYVGDTSVGKNVNIGAGTITCNYDGANKFKTVIEDDVFVGSDTQLVAPVTIGRGATIGAGSTITRDAPPDSLTVCRAKDQKTIMGWKRPQKIKK